MATKAKKKDGEFFTYKNKPLVRSGSVIYYGNMFDKYVIMMMVKSTKKVKDIDTADEIMVQLMLTDPEIKAQDRIVKKSEKKGFYPALDIAEIWLERALKGA
ncbi:MAG: hypothetical protein FWH14_02340 [Oscillospiraceae bacterium]|nr:hypothetical protein [Oscillospiraceae bacterium]